MVHMTINCRVLLFVIKKLIWLRRISLLNYQGATLKVYIKIKLTLLSSAPSAIKLCGRAYLVKDMPLIQIEIGRHFLLMFSVCSLLCFSNENINQLLLS